MLKTEILIETIGEPNIQALSESEQRTFFDTLFESIMELKQKTTTQSFVSGIVNENALAGQG